MSLTILNGTLKGQTLLTPNGDLIRPMSVRLKRRIFDANQSLEDMNFIDLCAGSGAVGFEALSRGAKEVHLIEKNRKVFDITKKNLETLKNKNAASFNNKKVTLNLSECQSWIKNYKNYYLKESLEYQNETIIYFSPPFEIHQIYFDILKDLDWYRGTLWLESDLQKGPSKSEFISLLKSSHLEFYKEYEQGTTYLMVFRSL